KKYPDILADSLERYRFREASQELMNLARLGNKYLADEEPWKVIKEDPERVKSIIYVGLQVAVALSVLSEPFLPFTSEKLKDMLALKADDKLSWTTLNARKSLAEPGHQLNKATLLFRKIEDKEIQKQLDKLAATKKANELEKSDIMAQKETISFEDFTKMDMRVGTVLEASKMPKTKKLMVLKVDTGLDTRTIVSGIAEDFEADDIIGKKVTVLVNLAPRPLRGVESQGMILMTENAEGKLVFLNPDETNVTNGSVIS
ncbi:MAG: methionine--tRNA ligase subunit beta, partial [Eudoraea sp.]|nr:methionine--tRNA ligase subunit beta [Eudoraea sp.]